MERHREWYRKGMGNLFSKHPLRTWVVVGLGFFVVTLPVYLGAIWPILEWGHIVTPLPDNQTLPQWIVERRWPGMTTTFFMWFVVAVSLLMLGLFLPLIRSVRQREQETKQLEAMALARQATQHTIEELQAKLDAIEDKQPFLTTAPLRPIQRKPGYHQYSGPHHLYGQVGEFALLRVTNEPTSLNSDAVAYQIYAKVSYCDEQWKELFPSVEGAWFSLWQSHGPSTIGPPKNKPDSLKPQTSTYLGIGLRYQRQGSLLHALSASSGDFPDWFDPDLTLSRDITYIKIRIGCHDFQTTYHYVLNHSSKEKLHLEPVSPPA